MGGLRPALAKYGVTLSILENAEVFGNLTGCVRQGFEENGLTTVTVQLDTQEGVRLERWHIPMSAASIFGAAFSAKATCSTCKL